MIPKGTATFLIDPPGPFAPLEELMDFQQTCQEMLREHPAHPQWLTELEAITKTIKDREKA